MPQRPRDIGTAAESAVLRVLRTAFPSAERSPLHGAVDQGDIMGTPFAWEVKGGKAAENASDAQIEAWLGEADVEANNHHDARRSRNLLTYGIGFLVTKRKAVGMKNADRWWVHLWSDDLVILGSDETFAPSHHLPVRLTLGDLIEILRISGYAERHDSSES